MSFEEKYINIIINININININRRMSFEEKYINIFTRPCPSSNVAHIRMKLLDIVAHCESSGSRIKVGGVVRRGSREVFHGFPFPVIPNISPNGDKIHPGHTYLENVWIYV